MLSHPLRGQIRSEHELRYISNLGNAESSTQSKPNEDRSKPVVSSTSRKLAANLRDENGEKMSQNQQAAIYKAVVSLEQREQSALEAREHIAEKLQRTLLKIQTTNEKREQIETDNSELEARVMSLKAQIAKARQEREASADRLDELRAQNELLKSRTLMDLDLRTHAIRQEIRETDKALRNAMWCSPTASSKEEDKTLPPVDSIVVAPKSAQSPKSTQMASHNIASYHTGDTSTYRTPEPSPAESAVISSSARMKKKPCTTNTTKKYEALADMKLKDVGEIQRAHSPMKPSSYQSSQHRSTSGPAFRLGTPPLRTPYSDIGSVVLLSSPTAASNHINSHHHNRGGPSPISPLLSIQQQQRAFNSPSSPSFSRRRAWTPGTVTMRRARFPSPPTSPIHQQQQRHNSSGDCHSATTNENNTPQP